MGNLPNALLVLWINVLMTAGVRRTGGHVISQALSRHEVLRCAERHRAVVQERVGQRRSGGEPTLQYTV